jgi:putative membrane protein
MEKAMNDLHQNGTLRGPPMAFLVLWAVNVLALWVAATVFPTHLAFAGISALFVSGLLLGLVNALIKPVLLILTLPLTVLTMGLFILVINALMLLLVAWLVPGFTVAGFWAGLWIAIFISLFSFVVNALLGPRL